MKKFLLCVLLLCVTASCSAQSNKEEKGKVPTADANADGVVDGLDQLIWAENNGTDTDGGPAKGDFNLDGKVNGLDYLMWAEAFSDNEILPEPEPVPDPEPASRLENWNINVDGVPNPQSDEEMIQTLRMFKPLQKQHLSWPWTKELHEKPELAHEVARISGSVGCSATWDDTKEEVDRAVSVAKSTGAAISLQYSPYHRYYAKQDARFWGEGFKAAVDDAQMVATRFKTLFDQAKVDLDAPDVKVQIVELDQELLRSDIDDATGKPEPFVLGQQTDQLHAVAAKNDIIYRIFKTAFPESDIVWHGFNGHGNYHSPTQLNDGWGVTELYQNESGPSLLKFAITDFVADGEAHGIHKFMPAVSLGGFYDVSVALPHPGYVRDKPYPVKFSWHKGRSINHPYFAQELFEDRYGPTWKIEKLYWWPSPFAPTHVGYGHHFVAYVAGAHNIKKSENDWLDTEEK